MTKRKLATIQVVKELNPIKGADLIKVASVLGWKVVVKNDDFKVGDKGVYFEVDSFLPDVPEYNFMGETQLNPITKMTKPAFGYRVHTVRLRGQLSQGLLIPFNNLGLNQSMTREQQTKILNDLPVGTDVTDMLGVTKFERPEVALGGLGNGRSGFPSAFAQPTDELRIQGIPESYKKLLDKPYYISSKIDGTSSTIIKHGNELIFATNGTTLSNDSSNVIQQFIEVTGIKDKLLSLNEDVVLQGEFYGEKIQGNHLGIVGNRIRTFNVIIGEKRLGLLGLIDFAGKLGLELPTIIEIGSDNPEDIKEIKEAIKRVNKNRKRIDTTKVPRTATNPEPTIIELLNTVPHNFDMTINEAIEKMDKTLYRTNNRPQEGGVFRLLTDNDNLDPISFKAINNHYLIKFNL